MNQLIFFCDFSQITQSSSSLCTDAPFPQEKGPLYTGYQARKHRVFQLQSSAVARLHLTQLNYEDPCIGSRPIRLIYWVHLNSWKEWSMELRWCGLWKYKLRQSFDLHLKICGICAVHIRMFFPFWILAKYVSFIRRCLHNEYLSTLFTRKPIQWNLELTGEPLCNEVFDITIFFTPVIVKYMKKNHDITINLSVPCPFVKSRFHCNIISALAVILVTQTCSMVFHYFIPFVLFCHLSDRYQY